MKQKNRNHIREKRLLLVLLPLICGAICLCLGRMQLRPGDVFSVILAHLRGGVSPDPRLESLIWGNRLPRIVLALCAGGGLSVAGAAFQSLFSNPLATPDTLGVASGASFGAALALLLGWKMSGVQLLAMVCGLATVAMIFLLSRGREQHPVTVILCGVVLSSLGSALVSLVKYLADADAQLPAITFWLMGTLSGASWKKLFWGLPLLLLGTGMLLAMRWQINLFLLGEDDAACGGNLRRIRSVTVICASAITAAVVSMCGQIGWIGLLIPHICRLIFGSDNRKLLPAACSLGAAALTVTDTLARCITAAELPISVLTAILGAPIFLYLLRRKGGWRL